MCEVNSWREEQKTYCFLFRSQEENCSVRSLLFVTPAIVSIAAEDLFTEMYFYFVRMWLYIHYTSPLLILFLWLTARLRLWAWWENMQKKSCNKRMIEFKETAAQSASTRTKDPSFQLLAKFADNMVQHMQSWKHYWLILCYLSWIRKVKLLSLVWTEWEKVQCLWFFKMLQN